MSSRQSWRVMTMAICAFAAMAASHDTRTNADEPSIAEHDEESVMIGDGFELCGEFTQAVGDRMTGGGFDLTLSPRIIEAITDDEPTASQSQPQEAPQPTPDLNRSGIVDAEDLILLLSAWGPQSMDRDSFRASADLTADGLVNEDDLAILLAAWGTVQNPIVPTE